MTLSNVPDETAMPDRYRPYRAWFFAAAIYNAVWGVAASLFPGFFLGLAGIAHEGRGVETLFMTIGMIVGVYAYGYWMLARDPSGTRGSSGSGSRGRRSSRSGSSFRRFGVNWRGRSDSRSWSTM